MMTLTTSAVRFGAVLSAHLQETNHSAGEMRAPRDSHSD